jgi:hypothetical protein
MSPDYVDTLYGVTIVTESSTIREYARSRVAGRLRHINIHGAKAKIIACKAQPVLAVHRSHLSRLKKLFAKLNVISTR